ncbi:MAG: AGE family epimerase/isomerase [Bacteroidales bacterium]|nr:AGE family epimerase/isomerase [Bacteroidales bacterium]
MNTEFSRLSEKYRSELLENIIPFWEKHSIDRENGGFFTCLDRQGRVYDTDKFIWLQGRQVWMFASLYNHLQKNERWLKIAEDGAAFLEKYGRDTEGNWYFSLTREGNPLISPYNIFSDCFATMAFAQLSKATGKTAYSEIAVNTFNNILKRADNPKGIYEKSVPGTRPLRGFSLPMILCNLALETEHLLDKKTVENIIRKCIRDVMEVFYDPFSGLIRENVTADGGFSDSFEGRLINPGHGIEAMWFIMDLAERNNDSTLAEKAVERTLNILRYGWDDRYGGIFYFMDIKGKPLQQLEWDQKLWWVHVETLISLIKGYRHTKNPECLEWFRKVHEYTWTHFPDPEFGEWFGYLNRRGEILLDLKGGKWKGCFHIPRGLYQVWKTLEKLS